VAFLEEYVMHRLLQSQLEQCIGPERDIPEEWRRFIDAVNEAYEQADLDRTLMERSLDLVSEELSERTERLKKQVALEQSRARLMEDQGQALLETVRSVAKAGSGVEIRAPEPLPGISRTFYYLVCEVEKLIGDMRGMLRERERAYQSLDERIGALDCLNDIGRRVHEEPSVPDFLDWVARRVPAAMRYPDACRTVIEFEGRAYGIPDAARLPNQITQGLRIDGELVGQICLAYQESIGFTDGDSAFLGDVARRVSGYIRSQRLLEQKQAALAEAEAAHRRYLRETWDAFLSDRETSSDGYVLDANGLRPAGSYWRPEMGQAMASGLVSADSGPADGAERVGAGIAVPLKSRGGQVIGVVDLVRTDGSQGWHEDERALIETLADQLAETIVGEQLFEQTQMSLAKLREVDKFRTQFLANMSHELRTPLNSIIGFSRVMLKGIDGPLSDAQRTDLEAIYNSGQGLLRLINDVLDMSKIEAGQMELIIESVDLKTMIEGVVSSSAGLVKDKPIALQSRIEPGLPTIQADPTRLRQVLTNLMSNAAKFTEKGTITVQAWRDGESVRISIADTGVGIPEDKMHLLFGQFRQLDPSSSRRAQGTGLGLAISQNLAEMHGGHIDVQSQAGIGSTFVVSLPIKGPTDQIPELVDLAIDKGKRVLLVIERDEAEIRRYRDDLEKQGYQVVGLYDGRQAARWARSLKPWAVVMDVQLEQDSGWEALDAIRSARATRDLPVIVCSALREGTRAINTGASAYLPKPVVVQELLDTLGRLDR
jgi:signal transduction histidine kinase/CheY-like chemotaxis protein